MIYYRSLVPIKQEGISIRYVGNYYCDIMKAINGGYDLSDTNDTLKEALIEGLRNQIISNHFRYKPKTNIFKR